MVYTWYGKRESSKGLIVMKLFQSIVILTECSTIRMYLRIFLRVFHYIQNYKYVKINTLHHSLRTKCTSEFEDQRRKVRQITFSRKKKKKHENEF